MIPKRIASIFRKGSRTYFYSSLFFPRNVREDVFRLYAFVRVADDLVDQLPQDVEGFDALVERYRQAAGGESSGDEVVDGFVALERRKGFEPGWTEGFLSAMRQDLTKRTYGTLSEVEGYMFGSAEVIGLMMARVMDLPDGSHTTARRLGKAMQYLNFLRDVDLDRQLGRSYVPQEVVDEFGLDGLSREQARDKPREFAAMMRNEIQRYRGWQAEAEAGYKYLPRRYRIPIQTAADMYLWTALEIEADPMRVFEQHIRPSVPRIVARILRNTVRAVPRPQEEASAQPVDVIHPTAG